MTFMRWTEDLELPHEGINTQHKALVGAVNALHATRDAGNDADPLDILVFLTNYTDEHFRDEEALMRAANYPGLDAHRERHAALLDDVQRRVQRYIAGEDADLDELLTFLDGWLRHHIAGADRELVDFLTAPSAATA